jgi:hypothetical protein
MKYLKKYNNFKESILIDLSFQNVGELMESLSVWYDSLLSSINAEEVDIYDTFKLPKEDFKDKLDLDFLEDNVEFINSLSSIALKKSTVSNSDDYETFLNKPCRFMFIFNIESNELENPAYLIFQVWHESLNKWDDVKLYKINDNVQKFYDTLISKTVELVDGDEKYIYTITGSKEWVLQNIENENDIYKKMFRKDEFQDLLSSRKIKVNII